MAALELRDTGSDNSPPPFDFGIRLGLVFITQAACLSSLAVLGLLLYIVVSNSVSSYTHIHDTTCPSTV